MSLTALGLVLAAAIMHATWNFAAKRAQGRQLFLLLCSLVSLVVFALPVAWVVAKEGLPSGGKAWLIMLASAVLHILYVNVLQRGYREADLSLVYPVARGTGPLLSLGLAASLLGERPSVQGLIGASVVILGVFLLAGGSSLLRSREGRVRAGLMWGALTGLFIAGYTTLDAYAVRTIAIAPLVLDYGSHVFRVLVRGLPALSRRDALVREWRRTWRYALVVGVLGPLGYILVLTALRHAPVSYVAPARELSMLFGAFFGARLLAEGQLMRRVSCATLIACGVMLIALGR
ncbi:MAG: EamA family transporter [Myxococcales bacterium]